MSLLYLRQQELKDGLVPYLGLYVTSLEVSETLSFQY